MPIEVESPEQLGYSTIECNLAESSVTDALFSDLKIDVSKLVLCYGDHLGKPELRKLIADQSKNIHPNDVLLCPGAAAALFIINTSLLEKDSHLIVVHPNYATNIETPRAVGCEISMIGLTFEAGFKLIVSEIEKVIKPNTKFISLTTPHNPTGVMLSEDDLKQVIKIAEKHNIYILLDETYRDLSFQEVTPLGAALSERVISVSSVSKAYGIPGIRMGWLICRDKKIMETFLAAKEQMFICNSVLDEEVAYQFLLKRNEHLKMLKQTVAEKFNIVKNWITNSKYMEWVEPKGGVVCFPRIKKEVNVDLAKFYKTLNEKHKTYVGPGHWFEMEDNYMRIGFGWPGVEELKKGVERIENALNES